MSFKVEITFKDLCVLVPYKKPEKGAFILLPDVRLPRSRHDSPIDSEPFHTHFPAVLFPPDSLEEVNGKPRLFSIRECGPKEGVNGLEQNMIDTMAWFPNDADLRIKGSKESFVCKVKKKHICHMNKIWKNDQPRPRLNPLLVKPTEEIKDIGLLENKLNLRVFLDNGHLSPSYIGGDVRWIFRAATEVRKRPKNFKLASAITLGLNPASSLLLEAKSFDGEHKTTLKFKKPRQGFTLQIMITNMTLELFLGLNLGSGFVPKEQNRAKHAKLYYDLTDRLWEGPRRIPYLESETPVQPFTPNELIFCPPAGFDFPT